jgi:glycosyltransferase involved in cell wall biosynthesis
MSEPLVSVIVCVRDGEEYLGEALDSIVIQGCESLEVLVVDDGSRDASIEVAKRHPIRPRIVPQERLGSGAALNQGVRAARGRFLAFLDHDDIWLPGHIQKMLARFSRDPDTDFVFGNASNTDRHLNQIGPPLSARLMGATMIKRASALKIGDFRNDVAHGVAIDWWSRAGLMGLKFQILEDVVLLRRIHGGNMGIRDRPAARRDLLRVIRDHLERVRR